LARRLGATDAQLSAAAGGDASSFEPAWRAAIEYAGAVTRGGGKVPDALFAGLAAHWSAPQIVEITAVIALFNYFNRFANALDIPRTR